MTDYFLAVGSSDDTLRTLEGPTFDVATTRFASGGDVNAVAFSPDGRYLAVGHHSSPYLTVMRTADWAVVQVPSISGRGKGVAWSPDGAYLAVAHMYSPHLTVISAVDWEVAAAPAVAGNAMDCAWSPDGAYLAVAHLQGDNLTVINAADWSVVPGPSAPGYGRGVAWSPDGAYLAVAHDGSPNIQILRAADWLPISGALGSVAPVMDCAWSPDGAYLAVAHNSNPRLIVLSVADWSTVSTPSIPYTTNSVAWSPDGAYLAAAHLGAPYLTVINAADWSVVPGTATVGAPGTATAWLPDINRPTRHGILYDHDGNPLSLPVQLLRRPAWARSQVVTPDPVSGAFTVRGFAPGDYHLLIPDTRPGATDDRLLRITLDEATGALAPLAVHMPYAGALATINGNATKAIGGAAVDDVIVRAWGSHGHVIDVVPAPSGDWSAEVPPGTYDITYRSAGCQPVCHGPYTIAAPEEQG